MRLVSSALRANLEISENREKEFYFSQSEKSGNLREKNSNQRKMREFD